MSHGQLQLSLVNKEKKLSLVLRRLTKFGSIKRIRVLLSLILWLFNPHPIQPPLPPHPNRVLLSLILWLFNPHPIHPPPSPPTPPPTPNISSGFKECKSAKINHILSICKVNMLKLSSLVKPMLWTSHLYDSGIWYVLKHVYRTTKDLATLQQLAFVTYFEVWD